MVVFPSSRQTRLTTKSGSPTKPPSGSSTALRSCTVTVRWLIVFVACTVTGAPFWMVNVSGSMVTSSQSHGEMGAGRSVSLMVHVEPAGMGSPTWTVSPARTCTVPTVAAGRTPEQV